MSPAQQGRSRPSHIAGGRGALLWAVLFYVVLAYATFNSLRFSPTVEGQTLATVALVAVLGIWYGYWFARPGSRQMPYLVGAAVLWAALLVLDPEFLVLGLGIFAPYCLQDPRWGIAVVLVVGGGWAWLEWQTAGTLSEPAILAIAVFTLAGVVSVTYVSTIARESERRRRLIDELRRTRAELAEAERHALVLDERRRLAHDIHDTLTQGFASIVMVLEAADVALDEAHAATRHVRRSLASARANLAESRRVVWALRPEPLTDATLPETIERLAAETCESHGLHAACVVTGVPRPLGDAHDTALLRVVQEALANVVRHAHADDVTVTLSYMDDTVVLDVQDDGIGFAPSATVAASSNGGVGLRSMRDRVHQLGGSVTVESAPGAGTTVAVALPRPPQGGDEAVGTRHG